MALPALAGSQLHNRFQQWDFERLERSAVKVARSVLRGRRRSNASLLPDRSTPVSVLPLSFVLEGYEVKPTEQRICRQFVVPTPFLSVHT
jgi:hypothetical protein